MALGPKNVWLRLYQLSEAFDASGDSDEARISAIADDLMTLPPELRDQSVARLEAFSDLSARIVAACKQQQ